jgi:signal transduction histidine kinase
MPLISLIEEMAKVSDSNIREISFQAGEMIIEKGSETPFFVIKSGTCRVFIHNALGVEVVLGHMKDGSALGEMSNFTKKLANANVVAESDSVLLEVSGEALIEVLREIPDVARELYLQLCNNLENTNVSLSNKVEEMLELNTTLEERVDQQVADIKKKNDLLEEQNQKMKALLESRDEFVNMVVHDLRSPLSNIIGYVELLRLSESVQSDEDNVEIANIILNNSSEMLTLINDILDYSKIESGHLELKIEPLEVEAILKQALDDNIMLYKGKNIELTLKIENGLPEVQADAQRVHEILNNLLSNALKFSERNTQVSLEAESLGEMVQITVRDHGQGIPESEMSKLFQTFQQVAIESTEGEKGTGLGLAIVNKLVELHGGSISVDSQLGKGSEFSFTLSAVD